MPKRKTHVLNSKFARDILNELEEYATGRQFYPVQNALFVHMTKSNPDRAAYDMTIGEFNYWFDRLVREKYIEVDADTRAIRCTHLAIEKIREFETS